MLGRATNQRVEAHSASQARGKTAGRPIVSQVEGVMRVQSSHWLDYDPVTLLVLIVGIGAVALIAFSI
jgi:hypothetical protein